MSRFVSRQEAIEKGLPRYFTGLPCKREHEVERYTASGNCVECAREAREKEIARYTAAREAAHGR